MSIEHQGNFIAVGESVRFSPSLTEGKIRLARIADNAAYMSFRSQAEVECWAEKALPTVEYGVEAAAVGMEYDKVTFFVPKGMQGGGKDLLIKGLKRASSLMLAENEAENMSESLGRLASSFGGKVGTITTGTDGIFNKPKGDYDDIYRRTSQITKPYSPSKGVLVPDAITSVFTELTIQRNFYEGFPTNIVNSWPRSEGQDIHAGNLIARLGKQGIDARLEMISLKLVDRATASHMRGNRIIYARASEALGSFLMEWLDETSGQMKELDPIKQNELINGKLNDIVGTASAAKPMSNLVKEIKLSTKRVSGRVLESSKARRDDIDLEALLRRQASYLKDTAPGEFKNPKVRLIAADQSPEEVICDVIKCMVGEENTQDDKGKRLLELAMESARYFKENPNEE